MLKRLRILIDRYKKTILKVVAVIVVILTISAEIFPEIMAAIKNRDIYLIIILFILMDIAYTIDTQSGDKYLGLRENQDDSINDLIYSVKGCHQADLLEYAGSTTLPLIRTIQRENKKIRLLIKHPDTLEGQQKNRSLSLLDTLYNSVFSDYTGKFEIRCYRLPFSLRGRHLYGQILELGWLTPDYKRQTAYGHGNPSLVVRHPYKENEYLKSFFEKTFDDYWNHSNTENGLDVLKRNEKKASIFFSLGKFINDLIKR